MMNRKCLRLKNYDYSSEGSYFVTICTQDRRDVFGEIDGDIMKLNDTGRIVEKAWLGLARRFPMIALDEFVIMPNHVHGIIAIVGAPFMAPVSQKGAINRAPTLGKVVRTFKAICTRQIHIAEISEFQWQRNYYEHVIRDESDLFQIRQYIQENPLKWGLDPENSKCEKKLQEIVHG